jgi:hypothetical protein
MSQSYPLFSQLETEDTVIGGLMRIPYFTHGKLANWIDEAGRALGYMVKRESRRKTHGKIFQIDSMWFQNRKLVAFVEAEKRWEMNHIIGHLICCTDYAVQEKAHPFFILVYLENEANHCVRLRNTWQWLTRMIPAALKVKCLPIYMRKNETRQGLHASVLTPEAFRNTIKEIIQEDAISIESKHSID